MRFDPDFCTQLENLLTIVIQCGPRAIPQKQRLQSFLLGRIMEWITR